MLDREEYVEQAYFFRLLSERIVEGIPMQELLHQSREESLATTKLPLAIDFMLSELKHSGVLSPAMAKLSHYFTPFQTYLIEEAEKEAGRFDIRVAIEVLRWEAEYRAKEVSVQGIFFYQFETVCRNRLRYEQGLDAISKDPIYDDDWRTWILNVRRQVGMVEFADLLYVCSQHYLSRQSKRTARDVEVETPVLFGEKEGRIALANRKKDPLYLFAALQRQLDYPPVPRPKVLDDSPQRIPQLMRRMERLEVRLKLMEDEQKQGIDLSKFYEQQGSGGKPPTGSG